MDDAPKRAADFNADEIADLEKQLADLKGAHEALAKRLRESDLDALRISAEKDTEIAALNDLVERMSRNHRKCTKEFKQSLRALLAHAEGTREATAKQIERARWRLEHL